MQNETQLAGHSRYTTEIDPLVFYAGVAKALHEQADNWPAGGVAYFIGGDTGCIKIGYSKKPSERLRIFQIYSPLKLRVLATAPGGELRESAYHAQFNHLRSHSEWFERGDDILAEINRLNIGPHPVGAE